MPSTPADRARQQEIVDLFQALNALGPQAKAFSDRLNDLHGATMADAEDRVLRLSGAVLLEHAASLFEDIFARAREGEPVLPGEARKFLFSELPQ